MEAATDRGRKSEVSGQRPDAGSAAEAGAPGRFFTRQELADCLKVSVRTVDTMVAGGEIPHLRLHGNFIRFYLPDVVRHLSATALVSKRRLGAPTGRKAETLKS